MHKHPYILNTYYAWYLDLLLESLKAELGEDMVATAHAPFLFPCLWHKIHLYVSYIHHAVILYLFCLKLCIISMIKSL